MIVSASSSRDRTGNKHKAEPIRPCNPLHLAIVFLATFTAVYGVETGALALIVGGGR